MASRYPALFVSIEMRQEEQTYGMAVHDTDGLSIPVYEAAEAEMDGLKREFVRPFDLEKGPLVRMALYRTEESVYFLADMHHIISDGLPSPFSLTASGNIRRRGAGGGGNQPV